jgi:Domain of unknown function (DUF6867)
MGVVYDNSLTAFVILTLLIGGGAAWMTGRALAQAWRSVWQLVFYAAMLSFPLRFLHWSLAKGTLLSAQFLLTDAAILIGIGLLSYRLSQTTQMVTQYPWLYRRQSPLSWTTKE